VKGDIWRANTGLSIPRWGLAVFEAGGKLYAVGGTYGNRSVPISNNEVFDPAVGSWMEGAPMPTPRWKVAAASVGGRLYVAGGGPTGNQNIVTDVVESYDPSTDTWAVEPRLPTARWGSTAAGWGDRLYVVGGHVYSPFPSQQALGTLEVLDTSLGLWLRFPGMPTPRWDAASAFVDGKLYVIGGFRYETDDPGSWRVLSVVEEYDPGTGLWRSRTPMPTPRTGMGVAVSGGEVFVFGGHDGANGTTAVLEAYDPSSDSWRTVAPSGTPPSEPVLFVHGWCGSAAGWKAMIEGEDDTFGLQQIDSARYGERGEWTRLSYSHLQNTIQPEGAARSQVYAIELTYDSCQAADCNETDPILVAQTRIVEKAFQLKKAIEFIRAETGHPKVALVGHSQGGLVARAYVQGLACPDRGYGAGAACLTSREPYDGDVSRLLTIDTPHLGADMAEWDLLAEYGLAAALPARLFDLDCAAQDTVSKREMTPVRTLKRGQTLLGILNATPVPGEVELLTLATYTPWQDGDFVVPYSSQDLKHEKLARLQSRQRISPIYANAPHIRSAGNRLSLSYLSSLMAHVSVTSAQQTVSIVDRELRTGGAPLVSVGEPRWSPHPFGANAGVLEFPIAVSGPNTGGVRLEFNGASTARSTIVNPRYLPGNSLFIPPGAQESTITLQYWETTATCPIAYLVYLSLGHVEGALLADSYSEYLVTCPRPPLKSSVVRSQRRKRLR
jgi:pimeloyl-ACP methyl ester carboxylesterase